MVIIPVSCSWKAAPGITGGREGRFSRRPWVATHGCVWHVMETDILFCWTKWRQINDHDHFLHWFVLPFFGQTNALAVGAVLFPFYSFIWCLYIYDINWSQCRLFPAPVAGRWQVVTKQRWLDGVASLLHLRPSVHLISRKMLWALKLLLVLYIWNWISIKYGLTTWLLVYDGQTKQTTHTHTPRQQCVKPTRSCVMSWHPLCYAKANKC